MTRRRFLALPVRRESEPRRYRRARIKLNGRVGLDCRELVLYQIVYLKLPLFSEQTNGQEPRPDYHPRLVRLPASPSYGRARYT